MRSHPQVSTVREARQEANLGRYYGIRLRDTMISSGSDMKGMDEEALQST